MTFSTELRNKLLESFPVGVVDAAELYAPAIGKMALDELVALAQLIVAKKYKEAQLEVRRKMSAQELADEKTKLADLAVLMAQENSDGWKVATSIVGVIMKAALSAALGGVLL